MSANAVASDEETGERQTTQHEASARTISPPTNFLRTDTLRQAFISLCLVDLVRSFDYPRYGHCGTAPPTRSLWACISSCCGCLCRSLS